jgi:hypothetical protein
MNAILHVIDLNTVKCNVFIKLSVIGLS